MEEQKHIAESPGKRCFSPQIKRIVARLQVINVSVPLYLKCHHIAKLSKFKTQWRGARRNGWGTTAVFAGYVESVTSMMLISLFPDIF